ncbi:MAG: helix-turn-helix transcriptional regulator [Patescibacteria group bacterium]
MSNNVYALRTAKGVTQEELAAVAGVTRQTIIAIEKGNYTPSVFLALKITKFFKKQLEEVFYIKYDPSIKTRGHGE